jgi:hypothetical protein
MTYIISLSDPLLQLLEQYISSDNVLYCDYSVGTVDKNYLFIPGPSHFPDEQ